MLPRVVLADETPWIGNVPETHQENVDVNHQTTNYHPNQKQASEQSLESSRIQESQ